MAQLTPGDYLYQSDQELFLVVLEEREDSYLFAAHGWRDISKDRIDEYIEDDKSKIHRQGEIEKLVQEEGDDETIEQFERLKDLFDVYEDIDVGDDGPESKFAFEEQ